MRPALDCRCNIVGVQHAEPALTYYLLRGFAEMLRCAIADIIEGSIGCCGPHMHGDRIRKKAISLFTYFSGGSCCLAFAKQTFDFATRENCARDIGAMGDYAPNLACRICKRLVNEIEVQLFRRLALRALQ